MPKPTPLDLSHHSLSDHLDLWDTYAKIALRAVLTFHGGCGGNEASAARFAAETADAMMDERNARLTGHKEAVEAEKVKEKGKAKKTTRASTEHLGSVSYAPDQTRPTDEQVHPHYGAATRC